MVNKISQKPLRNDVNGRAKPKNEKFPEGYSLLFGKFGNELFGVENDSIHQMFSENSGTLAEFCCSYFLPHEQDHE